MLTVLEQGGGATRMSPDVANAMSILQDRLLQSTRWVTVERLERSLDELLRNPHRSGDPYKMASSAWGNAGKVIRKRLSRVSSLDFERVAVPASADPLMSYLSSEAVHHLWELADSSILPARDREILRSLGEDARIEEIADRQQVSVAYARVLVSRARLHAFKADRKGVLSSHGSH